MAKGHIYQRPFALWCFSTLLFFYTTFKNSFLNAGLNKLNFNFFFSSLWEQLFRPLWNLGFSLSVAILWSHSNPLWIFPCIHSSFCPHKDTDCGCSVSWTQECGRLPVQLTRQPSQQVRLCSAILRKEQLDVVLKPQVLWWNARCCDCPAVRLVSIWGWVAFTLTVQEPQRFSNCLCLDKSQQ